MGYSPWGCKESDTTEQPTHTHTVIVEFSSRVHSRIQKFELMSIFEAAGHHGTSCEVTSKDQNTVLDLKL